MTVGPPWLPTPALPTELPTAVLRLFLPGEQSCSRPCLSLLPRDQLLESKRGQTLAPLHLLLHPVPAPRVPSAAPQAGGQPHRPAGWVVISSTRQTSHPAAQYLASSPWRGPGVAEEGVGSPSSSSWEGCGSHSCMSPLPLQDTQSLSLAPANTQPPRELGQDQELKSCTASTDTQGHHHPQHRTSSPVLKKENNRHTQGISETSK